MVDLESLECLAARKALLLTLLQVDIGEATSVNLQAIASAAGGMAQYPGVDNDELLAYVEHGREEQQSGAVLRKLAELKDEKVN